jgi:uncharacterized membrane protein HdeD (DUF308 family)
MLANAFSQYWWVVLLRGLVAIVFGLIALAMPGVTLATLIWLFAAFAFVDGCFTVFNAIGARKENENWWVLLLEGLLGVLFGVVAFRAPGITALVLLFYMAAWAIVSGALRIALAVRLRHEIAGEWTLGLSGLASIVFGVLIMAAPGAGALAVLWLIGLWALVAGGALVLLSFKVRGVARRLGQAGRPA